MMGGGIEQIPPEVLDEVEQAAREGLVELMGDGLDLDEALGLVSVLLDLALPLRAILPPPWGTLAENADRQAIEALLELLEAALRRDPERVEARADRAEARGNFLVAARRRARAKRIRERQRRRED
jgi:predicted RNA methylase